MQPLAESAEHAPRICHATTALSGAETSFGEVGALCTRLWCMSPSKFT